MTYEVELRTAKELARQAAAEILKIYDTEDLGIEMKEEEGYVSPLTKADLAANKIILSELKRTFREDGFLTEEEEDDKERLQKRRVWIIDPLDGTKEFIKRNGEFTVNIALVENGEPAVGVVAVPAQGKFYYARKGAGAFLETDGKKKPLTPSKELKSEKMVLVVSKSHRTKTDEAFATAGKFKEMRPAGSSVKGCLVAEGTADAYFRSGPQHEWDICAMDMIIREAGAEMTNLAGRRLCYNQENTLLHGFLVSNGRIHQQLIHLLNQ